ncbi:ion channel protein, partial [Streptomyces sp. SID7982]|nr:ion channel protein [Streptomyces sp. SID7982]
MAPESPAPSPTPPHPRQPPATPARRLLPLVLPAIVVGVVCALILLGVSLLAEQLQDVLWESLPDALGVGRFSSVWMVVMLTATG